METQTVEKPIRVGVFSDIRRADQAVQKLMATGFTKKQITVIASDRHTEAYFQEYVHQPPAGANTPQAVTAGSTIGTILGGLAAVAGAVTTGGVGLLVAGVALLPAGAVVGGFVGAMMTQGIEKELANYYDQAVSEGKILVAAEHHGHNAAKMLAIAEDVFESAGAEPVELPEG